MRFFASSLGALLLVSSPALAQVMGLGSPHKQFGGTATTKPTTHILNLQAATASKGNFNGFLGVTHDVQGNFWATSRRDLANTTNPHMLHKFDKNGKYLTSFPQPSSVNSGSSWGIRDMAFERKISPIHIYGSCENSATSFRVLAFNVITGKWDPPNDFKVPAAIGTSTVRALAFDPLGNSGNGSIWTANFSSQIFEFDLVKASSTGTPKILNTYQSAQTATYGFAYDAARKTMWAHGQSGTTTPTPALGSLISEIHTTSSGGVKGTRTGVRAAGDRNISGSRAGGVAGGMEMYVDGNGNRVFLLLTQASADALVTEYGRFQHDTSSGGSMGMNDQYPIAGNLSFGLTLGGSKGTIGALFIGAAPVSVPLVGAPFLAGTKLLINPPTFLDAKPVAAGKATVPAPIPADTSLVHKVALFQFVELVGAPPQIATSDRGNLHIH